MVHTLRLDNYTPIPRKLVLGTNSSFGTESIKIERGAGWDGLNLTATWHIPGREEPLRVALLDGDTMDVPPEVTKEAKDGVLVLAGLAPGVQRASCNVEYLIIEQAGVYGGADAEPTPELAEQVLQAVQDARDAAKDADKSATNAKDIAQSVRTDADNGKFNGKDGAKGDKGDDGTTPQLKIGEDNLWHVSYDNGATWVSLGVKATGAAGKDGADGVTPHIGENGNWWFGDTDTGVSAKGIKGNPGPQGPPGEIPEDYPQIRKDVSQLKEEIGEKLDNFYISNAHVMKRTSTGSIGSHYLIKYSVNFDDYQIMKFVVPSTGKTYKIEFANSQSEVLKTVDTSGFVYGSEVLLSIPLTTSEIIVEVAYEVGVNLEITLYKKININAEDVAGAMQTSVYTNYNNLLRAENITDNVEIQQYAEVINDQYVSAYIPVVNGETIYCNYSLGTPVAWLCGEDKKRITSVTLPLSNNQVSRNVGYTIVTENAKWIRLSWKKDRQGIEGALFFSNKPIRFIENDVVIKKEYVPELNTGRLNNWWYMKNGDSLGDSLTGQGYFQSWTRRFFGLNDFKNHGVGGSKLSGEDIDSTRPSMWKDVRIDALSTTADFVTVLGGQNDGNVEIGDITKTNYDTNTYVGALNTIIDKIYNHCKDGVIIILCTPFYVPAEGDGERFVLLDEAVRGVAKLHGLPVADFGGLSTADKNTANVYWGDDKTHPTEKFYKDKIAPILINTMEQINPINWDDVNYYTES